MKLLLLGRPECGLCEEFEQALLAHAGAVQIERADVDSREDWQRRYGLRVPVLLGPQGQVLGEVRFDPEFFDSRLASD